MRFTRNTTRVYANNNILSITATLSLLTWERIKTAIIIVVALCALWVYKDLEFQKSENLRQSENASQLRKEDSLRFASQTYTRDELDEYLDFRRKDLKDFLAQNKVSTKRIENIITQKLEYYDTLSRKQDLTPILDAIRNERDAKVAVKDSTDCLIIEGWVVFENDSLKLDITNREFKNITDVVSYWERNQWKTPFGFKTRLFGRKKATVIVNDKCGISRTIVIDKKK